MKRIKRWLEINISWFSLCIVLSLAVYIMYPSIAGSSASTKETQADFDVWLSENDFTEIEAILRNSGIESLYDVVHMNWNYKKLQKEMHPSRYKTFHERALVLRKSQSVMQGQSFISKIFIGAAIVFITYILILLTCFIHMLSSIRSPRWPVSLQLPKHNILDLVTGHYLSPQNTQVEWGWEEPQTVGASLSFSLKFFCRNGMRYSLSTLDNLLVEITHCDCKVCPTICIGDAKAKKASDINVSFTVHISGEYKIGVLVAGKHIKSSPFLKVFNAGPMDLRQSSIVGQSSLVVFNTSSSHAILLELRDRFGNISNDGSEELNDSMFSIQLTSHDTHEASRPHVSMTYESVSGRYLLNFTVEQAGSYGANVCYNDSPMQHGSFSLLALTESEQSVVSKCTGKKKYEWFEARLIEKDRNRKVYCYLSQKQLKVKEMHLKFFSRMLHSYRVCPSTKIIMCGLGGEEKVPIFEIDDGSQSPIRLTSADRNIIAAVFSFHLLKRMGGSESFQDKQEFFQSELRQHHRKKHRKELTMKVNRQHLLQSSLKVCKGFSAIDWFKRFEIVFEGEDGIDWGGLSREWFDLITSELFSSDGCGMFSLLHDSAQAMVHPNEFRAAHLRLKHYEFAGRVVGKCLYESALGTAHQQYVKARFSRSFLAQIIGLRVSYKHFEVDDPEFYTTKIRYIEENSIEDMDLYFAEEKYSNGKLELIDLVPNGARKRVTDANKLDYLNALAQHRLVSSVRSEVDAFLRGLNEIIPENLLSMFDEYELELLMCGTDNYSISQFKMHHLVEGTSLEFFKVLEWFWTIVSGFTQAEMARLVQFTTGSSLLPPGGFSKLNPKFGIMSVPSTKTLPIAHTCFNQLCLPDYDSLEQLHHALLTSLNEGSQGFGLV